MAIPMDARVTAVVNLTANSSDGEHVAITLSTNETAVFVVLAQPKPLTGSQTMWCYWRLAKIVRSASSHRLGR